VSIPDTGRRSIALGLRARLVLIFALGAFVLSALMGAIAYLTTRHTLIVEQQSALLHQGYANAALLRSALAAEVPSINAEVSGLDAGQGSTSLLDVGGRWYSTSLTISRASLPAALRSEVKAGHVALQTSDVTGPPLLSIGIPIPAVDADYYLVDDLSSLQHTLRVLLVALAAAGAATTLLGALLGLAASRRAMRPLTDVSEAAIAIAGGDLSTRLPVDGSDPDLSGLTRSFNAMVDQLQDRLERDARFASDVSHELRSPLTTLSAAIGVMERGRDQLDERSAAALDLLAADVGRFERLVTDLLELAASAPGSDDGPLDLVEAGELVRRCVESSIRATGAGEAAELRVDEDARHALVLVDKRRVERIVANLLENAANYAGGASAVEVARRDASLEVTVVDHGPGIAEEERLAIFDRFYRGSAAGRRGAGHGTGLGLALVAEHVRRLGGDVRVDPASGGGSRFVVALPIVEDDR
jgi:signal transduction histidine kinase